VSAGKSSVPTEPLGAVPPQLPPFDQLGVPRGSVPLQVKSVAADAFAAGNSQQALATMSNEQIQVLACRPVLWCLVVTSASVVERVRERWTCSSLPPDPEHTEAKPILLPPASEASHAQAGRKLRTSGSLHIPFQTTGKRRNARKNSRLAQLGTHPDHLQSRPTAVLSPSPRRCRRRRPCRRRSCCGRRERLPVSL
jgi:hypothetical protein